MRLSYGSTSAQQHSSIKARCAISVLCAQHSSMPAVQYCSVAGQCPRECVKAIGEATAGLRRIRVVDDLKPCKGNPQ